MLGDSHCVKGIIHSSLDSVNFFVANILILCPARDSMFSLFANMRNVASKMFLGSLVQMIIIGMTAIFQVALELFGRNAKMLSGFFSEEIFKCSHLLALLFHHGILCASL